MSGSDDNNKKGVSSRDQDKQSGEGSQNTSQNKSNVSTQTKGGNRPEPDSASEQNANNQSRAETDGGAGS